MLQNNKKLRNDIVNYLYNIIDKSKYPNDLIGMYIFSFHFFFSFIFNSIVFIYIFYSKNFFLIKYLLISLLTILLLWVYFDGCLVTCLERKLMNKKYTQHDIIYYIFNQNNIPKKEIKHFEIKMNNILTFILFILLIISIYYN